MRTSAALPPPPPVPGALLAAVFLALVLLWGSTWWVITVGLRTLPPFLSLSLRFLIAGPALLVVLKLTGRALPFKLRDQPLMITIGLLSFAVSYGVVYWAEQYVSSGLAAVIFALFPLFTGIIAHFWLGTERLHAGKLVGLAAALGGIVVINQANLEQLHPRAPLAAMLLVLSPLSSAVAAVLSKTRVHDFPALALAGMPMVYGGAFHLGMWWVFERHLPVGWTAPAVASVLYLAVFGSMITFGGYFWLLRRMEVGRAALIAYLTPIVALAVGAILGNEPLTPTLLAGSALVLGGVALANRPAAKAASRKG